MPPGRHGGRLRRTGPMFGASVAGILNSSSRSDEEARNRVIKLFGSILAVLFLFDIGCSFAVLLITCHQLDSSNFIVTSSSSPSSSSLRQCLVTSIHDGFSFHPVSTLNNDDDGDYNNRNDKNFGDLFLLAILRCCMTLLLLKIGSRYGTNGISDSRHNNHHQQQRQQQQTSALEASTVTPTASEPSTSNTDSLEEPLLANQQQQQQQESTAATTLEQDEQNHHHKKIVISPTQAKNAIFVCLFVTSAFYQVYAGLRVATSSVTTYDDGSDDDSSDNHHSSSAAVLVTILLCLTVLWINGQGFVFRTLLDELTREGALYLPPEVHRHPMYYQDGRGLAMHWCDLCRSRISPGSGCYRCSLCDFDVCTACARRNDAAIVGENVLRGDRGVRVEMSLTTGGYFSRSLKVARKELPLLLLSFVLLAASCMSRLLLPHYQGKIIDKVIPQQQSNGDDDDDYDKAGFRKYIQIYIWLMIAQGAVSTIYSAIFTLVSRRLKFTIRNSLLEKILSQDVAYFDGTESGRLISCLTNDLDLMMAPIQSSLSSLLSNILILFGGMIMCFYKSYRLSMLAFVTVGPISYLWEQYALWSKGLAREMLSHWAEGNSIASQALSHVRTVKAFGCEDKVLDKYSEANQQALDCGIKDAWGNGITSALTGYLDLGAGVLILYFGGLLVCTFPFLCCVVLCCVCVPLSICFCLFRLRLHSMSYLYCMIYFLFSYRQWRTKCRRTCYVSTLLEYDEQCLSKPSRTYHELHSQCSRCRKSILTMGLRP